MPQPEWHRVLQGNVLMMGLVSLFTDFSSEMMNPLLPAFVAGLLPPSWTALVLGGMEGLAESTASLLKVVSGRLSDRWHKRKALVVAGYGLSSIARPLIGLTPGTPPALGAVVMVGLKLLDRVGKGLRTSPRDALIGDSVEATHRGLAFSFHRAMDHLGAVAGPLTALVVLDVLLGRLIWYGGEARVSAEEVGALRWLFGVALLPGVVAVLVLILRVVEIVPAAAPAASRPLAASPPRCPSSSWRRLPGRFYAYVVVVSIFALGNASDLFLLLLARDRFELGLAALMGLWIVLHLSKIVFSLPGGALSDWFGRRPLIVAGWLVYALVYLRMGRVAQAWQFWSLFALYGLYYGLTEGAEKALVADFVPSRDRATAFGLFHGAVSLAALPASFLFGLLWSRLGPTVAFEASAAAAGLATLLLLVLLSQTAPIRTDE